MLTKPRSKLDFGPPQPVSRRYVTVWVTMFAALGLFGVVMACWSWQLVAYSEGHGGTPGRIVITRCEHSVRTRQQPSVTQCQGDFHPAGGGAVDHDASAPVPAGVGSVVKVRRTTDGDYAEVGTHGVAGDIAGIVGGLFLLAVSAGAIIQAFTKPRPVRAPVFPTRP